MTRGMVEVGGASWVALQRGSLLIHPPWLNPLHQRQEVILALRTGGENILQVGERTSLVIHPVGLQTTSTNLLSPLLPELNIFEFILMTYFSHIEHEKWETAQQDLWRELQASSLVCCLGNSWNASTSSANLNKPRHSSTDAAVMMRLKYKTLFWGVLAFIIFETKG